VSVRTSSALPVTKQGRQRAHLSLTDGRCANLATALARRRLAIPGELSGFAHTRLLKSIEVFKGKGESKLQVIPDGHATVALQTLACKPSPLHAKNN